jgi:hypothetical protein
VAERQTVHCSSLAVLVLGPQFHVLLILFIPSSDGLAVVSHFLFSTTGLLVTGQSDALMNVLEFWCATPQ